MHPKKIIAFGASISKNSINKVLAHYTASLFTNDDVQLIDLLDYYPLPIYSIDHELENGIPENARRFHDDLALADMIIISLAEHNGSYTSGFKNLFDWSSRVHSKLFEGKDLLLLSTSPGPRGGLSALEAATKRFPFHGGEIVGRFTLPEFGKNFDPERGITNEPLRVDFQALIDPLI